MWTAKGISQTNTYIHSPPKCPPTQAQERFLFWDLVLRCSCNSSELYASPLGSFLPLCTYAANLGFSCLQQHTTPRSNISSCWPSPWGPVYFLLLSGLNWDSPTEHNVFGHQPGEWPPFNCLSSQKSPSCNWHGLQWPSNMNLSTVTRGSCQGGLSELQLQWVSCHLHVFISAAGLKTICRRNMGFTLFVLKINIYWMRNYNVSIKKIILSSIPHDGKIMDMKHVSWSVTPQSPGSQEADILITAPPTH